MLWPCLDDWPWHLSTCAGLRIGCWIQQILQIRTERKPLIIQLGDVFDMPAALASLVHLVKQPTRGSGSASKASIHPPFSLMLVPFCVLQPKTFTPTVKTWVRLNTSNWRSHRHSMVWVCWPAAATQTLMGWSTDAASREAWLPWRVHPVTEHASAEDNQIDGPRPQDRAQWLNGSMESETLLRVWLHHFGQLLQHHKTASVNERYSRFSNITISKISNSQENTDWTCRS